MTTYVFDRSQKQGRLELTDRDRFDLLHRMSTNDFTSIQVGEGRSTVLTTALARIIDRVIVYNLGETALMLTNQPGAVRSWLQKHIFFQDKVKLRDVSAEKGQLELYGPSAAEIIEQVAPGARAMPLHSFSVNQIDEQPLVVAKTFPMAGDGYVIVAAASVIELLKVRFASDPRIVIGDDSRYELLRIEAGLPGPGHELTEEYIPLEANLWDSVSFTKGCYIGQEIIARMESRNRLAKTLVSLQLPAVVPIGASLADSERTVGSVTSIATRDDGTVIGLGFVKPDRAEPGVKLEITVDNHPGGVAEVVTALAARQAGSTLPTHR